MRMMVTHSRRIAVIAHDLAMVAAAWTLASLARFDFSLAATLKQSSFLSVLVLVVAAQGAVLWWSGLYRGVWRFASVRDLWNIVRAAAVGVLVVGIALILYNRLAGVPRTTLLLFPVFLVFLLGGPRLLYRIWRDHRVSFLKVPEYGKRVLVLGAGRSGETLVRDMLRGQEYQPIGFLDDQKRLKGSKVHGVPVLGRIDRLRRVVAEQDVDIIVIAMPSASTSQMRRVVELCEETGLPFRTLPRLNDMVAGEASLKELREVSLDDLLGRDPVSLDWPAINEGLRGKTILVSGGGGSIGSELCRQLARLRPASLVIFERSEYNLYSIEMELRAAFPDVVLHACLGDVADPVCVEHTVRRYKPDVIFHAAAYKHVPMLQEQVREALHNNVIGTWVLAQAAHKHRCESFVMISTDKAVNPTNVMGASKRIAEIYCQNFNRYSSTQFITVRFGNVLGSAGSVVPLFQRQIASGGPVTVTHPEITRYFMTIPEASQLIMQAGVMGDGGEIFVLDMGEPVKISYLAEQLIRLSGKTPGKDVHITYTGLRPGEKLYEELFHEQEDLTCTGHQKILLARSRQVQWDELQQTIRSIESACGAYDEKQLKALIKELVPEMEESVQQPGEANVIPLVRTAS